MNTTPSLWRNSHVDLLLSCTQENKLTVITNRSKAENTIYYTGYPEIPITKTRLQLFLRGFGTEIQNVTWAGRPFPNHFCWYNILLFLFIHEATIFMKLIHQKSFRQQVFLKLLLLSVLGWSHEWVAHRREYARRNAVKSRTWLCRSNTLHASEKLLDWGVRGLAAGRVNGLHRITSFCSHPVVLLLGWGQGSPKAKHGKLR